MITDVIDGQILDTDSMVILIVYHCLSMSSLYHQPLYIKDTTTGTTMIIAPCPSI